MTRSANATLLGVALLATSSCGGSEPLPEVPTAPVHDDDDEDYAPEVGATAEVGAMPEEETVAAFSNSLQPIQNCFMDGVKRIEFLSGEIAFNVVVGRKGRVENIFAERSTLGDRQTEQCMFGVLRGAAWPEPVGGLIGVAQNGFEFQMSDDIRPPVELTNFDADDVLADVRSEIRGCKHGASGKFTATVYIDTNGSPISAGIAAPDKTAESASDCLVDVLKGAKFPQPGSWPAKVTFTL
jgi:hypothetical protein